MRIKVLIISTNAIGDTYLSLSAISYLNLLEKDVTVDVLTTPNSLFLLNSSQINKVILEKRTIFSVFRTLKIIRRQKYDYSFSFFPGIVNSLFLMLSKSYNKGGYLNLFKQNEWFDKNQRGFIKSKNRIKIINWSKDSNFIFRIKSVIDPLFNLNYSLLKYSFPGIPDYKEGDFIVLHPFSKREFKSLSKLQVSSIISYFKKNFPYPIYIIGDNKINVIENEDVSIIPYPEIEQLVKLVNCKLFISVDSFPIHLADAYNTKFIGLFSATTVESVLINNKKGIQFDSFALQSITSAELIESISEKIYQLKYF